MRISNSHVAVTRKSRLLPVAQPSLDLTFHIGTIGDQERDDPAANHRESQRSKTGYITRFRRDR